MFHDLYAGFHNENMDNGLSVYVKEWPDVSWSYTGIVVHAGAKEDYPAREGLAHVVEHLVSENVAGFTFAQLQKRLKVLGGQGWFGTTSYLASQYAFHVPNDPQKVFEGLHLFGQMLLSGTMVRHIEEEKQIICREYHATYEHEEVRTWYQKGRPFLFANHPRLRTFESPIGVMDEFVQSTPEDIQHFYDTYYVPWNMHLVCIGSRIHDIVSMVQDTPFALTKPGGRVGIPPAFVAHEPKQHELTIHLSDFARFTIERTTCTFEWVVPISFARYSVRILGDMLEILLLEKLRYDACLTYDVHVNNTYYQDCWTLSLQFDVPPASTEAAKDLVWQALRAIPCSQTIFLEAKQERLSAIYRIDYCGYDLLQTVMSDLELYQHLVPFAEELRQIEAVTFDEIIELSTYLTPERSFCFLQAP